MPRAFWQISCGLAGVAGLVAVLAAGGVVAASSFSIIGPDETAQVTPTSPEEVRALRQQVAGEGPEGLAAAKQLWATRPAAAEAVLGGGNRQANLNMIAAIRGSSTATAVRALSLAMQDCQDDVRAAAADALGVAGSGGGAGLPPSAVRRLAVGSEDHSPAVRQASVKALAGLNGPAAQKHLSEIALYGSRSEVRVAALLAVARQTGAGREALLHAAAADRDRTMAGAAQAVIAGRTVAADGSVVAKPDAEAGHLSTIELMDKKGQAASPAQGSAPAATGGTPRESGTGLAALLASAGGAAAPAGATAGGQNQDLTALVGALTTALKGNLGNSDQGKQAVAVLQQMQADGTLAQLVKAAEAQSAGGGEMSIDSLGKLAQEYLGKDATFAAPAPAPAGGAAAGGTAKPGDAKTAAAAAGTAGGAGQTKAAAPAKAPTNPVAGF